MFRFAVVAALLAGPAFGQFDPGNPFTYRDCIAALEASYARQDSAIEDRRQLRLGIESALSLESADALIAAIAAEEAAATQLVEALATFCETMR